MDLVGPVCRQLGKVIQRWKKVVLQIDRLAGFERLEHGIDNSHVAEAEFWRDTMRAMSLTDRKFDFLYQNRF
jgi:hypothetical protein